MSFSVDHLPPVPCLKYEEVRGHIQSGDLLLCSGTSIFSRLIKRATGSIWSHVGFILRFDEIDRIMILESVESIGVRTVPLSHYLSNYNGEGQPYAGDLLIARNTEIDHANIGHLSRKAVDLLGHRYDKGEIVRIASRIVMGKFIPGDKCEMPVQDNEYVCSEYVYECYKSIGLNIAHHCGGFISPADFAMTKEIEAVCVLN